MRIVCVLLVGLVINSCHSSSLNGRTMKDIFKALTSFEYHFQDSSVPPPYHRSYTIQADSSQVQVWVFCYGDTLATETYPLPDSALQRVGQALQDNGIKKHLIKKKMKGCTGGVGHEIMYTSAVKDTSFSASRYVCGGSYEGDLKGDVEQFLRDIAFLTPNLKKLIESTQ